MDTPLSTIAGFHWLLTQRLHKTSCCYPVLVGPSYWQPRVTVLESASYEPPHTVNKMTVRPAKTKISLGIHPVCSSSSLCAQWVAKDPSFLHADSEDSDQTDLSLRRAHMPFCWFCYDAMRWLISHLSHIMRKPVFGYVRPAKTQTGLLSYKG